MALAFSLIYSVWGTSLTYFNLLDIVICLRYFTHLNMEIGLLNHLILTSKNLDLVVVRLSS